MVFKCVIYNEQCDLKTLIVADSEEDALAKVMVRFGDLQYTEEDVTVSLFAV